MSLLTCNFLLWERGVEQGESGVNSEYGTDVLLLLGPLPSGRGRVRCYGILIGDEFRNFFYEGKCWDLGLDCYVFGERT